MKFFEQKVGLTYKTASHLRYQINSNNNKPKSDLPGPSKTKNS